MSASGLGVDVWWVRVGGVRISVVFDFRSLGVQRLGIYLQVHAAYKVKWCLRCFCPSKCSSEESI